MHEWKPHGVYRLLSFILAPVFVGHALLRSLKDGGKRYLLERCAITVPVLSGEHPCLWIHAASVGEVLTVAPLLRAHQGKFKNPPVLVTTTTPTGASVLVQQQIPGVHHHYLPIDTGYALKRFLNRVNIKCLWVVETEIWPWLFARCKQKQIPVTIINGRLSERTMKRSSGVPGRVLRKALEGVRVLARSELDAAHYLTLGTHTGKTVTTGNLKLAKNMSVGDYQSPVDRKYAVAASTHHDEEIQIATAWRSVASDLLLVIVPRHPERGRDIQKKLHNLSISCALRSRQEYPAPDHLVYIADTVGELMAWYAHATAAFVGGSLITHGGQNMLEPALFGCPTIVGTHTHNFDEIMQSLLQDNGISVVNNATEAATGILEAASGNPEYLEMAERARKVALASRNILQKYCDALM
ncbi:MAG: 3-deoxy-D-manno-octulosonic acid transferase [Granulosicoccus sp.]